ncbi:MAG: alpha/beta hydrolase [Bacteroidales bacterium]|nr:alpha/beta hydrolase [Bacteroidales bacterium]
MLNNKIKGEGFPIVFLHGYLENLELWEEFTEKLENFKSVLIDLPGCGKSDLPELKKKFIGGYEVIEPLKPSIEQIADEVIQVVKHYNVELVHLVGHSMGGYVALAILEKYPDMVKTLCLLNSHPFADTPERKQNRLQEIEIIKQGKKNLIIDAFIQKLYSPTFNNDKYIQLSKQMALNTHEDTMIYCLLAMKDRIDRSELLVNTNKPVLWLLGENDPFVPFQLVETIQEKANLKKVIIPNSAHMSIFECPDLVLNTLIDFFNSNK